MRAVNPYDFVLARCQDTDPYEATMLRLLLVEHQHRRTTIFSVLGAEPIRVINECATCVHSDTDWCPTVRIMAMRFRHHPDYNTEWSLDR